MKEVFSYNLDINKTAYLNWRTYTHQPIHNFQILAQGYIKAAIDLAQECIDNNIDRKADILIFPMLFSANHGIELFVKSICWSLNILLGYKSSYKENHDIRGIWLTAKQKIKEFGFETTGSNECDFYNMIKTLEVYLDELSVKIGKGGDINYQNITIIWLLNLIKIKMNKLLFKEKINLIIGKKEVSFIL